jgi:hypothetical protein
MRTLALDEVEAVSGGASDGLFVIQNQVNWGQQFSGGTPFGTGSGISGFEGFKTWLEDQGVILEVGSAPSEEGSGGEVTITCKKPSSGADNDGGFGDCWLDKSGLVVGGLSAVALLLSAAYPPLAAVFGVLAGMVGVVTALSCLVHVLGDFCWTKHNPLPG